MTLMTSWAVVCDVFFLEPQIRQTKESAQEFAERVQRLIAKKANLKIAPWDGYLKYYNLGKKVKLLDTALLTVYLISFRRVSGFSWCL